MIFISEYVKGNKKEHKVDSILLNGNHISLVKCSFIAKIMNSLIINKDGSWRRWIINDDNLQNKSSKFRLDSQRSLIISNNLGNFGKNQLNFIFFSKDSFFFSSKIIKK
jgi:hypothetical protein